MSLTKEEKQALEFWKFSKNCDYRQEHKIRKQYVTVCTLKHLSHCTIENCKAKGVFK
jgi:hypothetical protein